MKERKLFLQSKVRSSAQKKMEGANIKNLDLLSVNLSFEEINYIIIVWTLELQI